ncbi:MAG: DJ-1 family protein [bacterium]|nr:DJ-1 family protein [bacterium]
MLKKVLVPLADGTEEIEAVAVIDVLRRAGAEVTVASVMENQLQITASRGVKLTADKLITDCRDVVYDLIVLPGGMPGAEHLRDSAELKQLLEDQNGEGRLYAAICASPAVAFLPHGLLSGRRATCHPGRVQAFENTDTEHVEARVVADGNCITSQGPATAIEFSIKLVELLYGKQKAADVAGPMVMA